MSGTTPQRSTESSLPNNANEGSQPAATHDSHITRQTGIERCPRNKRQTAHTENACAQNATAT